MAAHRLAAVRIENFKSIRNEEIDLDEVTAIIGPNNAGKSNLLDAVTWGLRFTSLAESEFNDPSVPVVITARVDGISEAVLTSLGDDHREAIREYVVDGKVRLRRTQDAPGASARACPIYLRDPSIEDEEAEGAWKKNPRGIDPAIQRLFPDPIRIGAMEDAAEDVAKWKTTTTIGRLLSTVMKPIEEEHGAAFDQGLEILRKQLGAEGDERLQELKDIDDQATSKVAELFPGLKVRVHIPPPEVKQVFKTGTIRVQEEDRDRWLDIGDMGHGAQRAIQMALIQFLAEQRRGDEATGTRTLLLIDEPELYLHPRGIQQVRAALQGLAGGAYQVVLSTHSPLMIPRGQMPSTLVVRKTTEGTKVAPRMAEVVRARIADATHQAEVLFSLTHSSEVLFSERVLLVEGKTERRLLPVIYEKVRGCSLGANKIGIVDLGGGGSTGKALGILQGMGLDGRAVVDLDFAFREAVAAGFLSVDDDALLAGRDRLAQLAAESGFDLDDERLPKRTGDRPASEAFKILGADEDAVPHIQALHDALLDVGVWLWRGGTIEVHLGLLSKKEPALAAFARRLEREELAAVAADAVETNRLLDWLDEARDAPPAP